MIPFDEIESIVVGLSELSPIVMFSRKYKDLVAERREAFFIRLRWCTRYSMALLTFHYRGGAKLMREFLRLNAAKVVGAHTYSLDERKNFAWAKVNTIVHVQRQARGLDEAERSAGRIPWRVE